MISIHSDDLTKVKTYDLGPEFLLDAGMGSVNHGPGRPPNWKPLFWPPHIKREQMEFKTSENQLTDQQLFEYGKKLSEIRAKLRTKAETFLIEKTGSLE